MDELYTGGRRERRERFDVLRDWTKLCELEAADNVEIRMQTGAQVKMTLSGTFHKNDEVDFLNDYIRPMLYENGKWVPLGVFMVANASENYVDDSGMVQIDGRDCSALAQRQTLEGAYVIPAGELYTQVVQQLLYQCGIDRVRCVQSSARLATDRADWEIGTSILEIINQLLLEINYDDLWFDSDGYARIEPPATIESGVKHEYYADETSILEAEYSIESNAYSSYNVFIAVVSSPDLEAPLYAIAENDDPASPLSTTRRGRVPMPVINLDNIASQEDLQVYVDKIRNQSITSTETVEFTTAVTYHGVGDYFYLNHHNAKGIWKETEWTMEMGPGGMMSHTAIREVMML